MKYNPVTMEDINEFFPDGISWAHLRILTLDAYKAFAADWGFYNLYTRVEKLQKRSSYFIYGLAESDIFYYYWLYTRLNEWAETLSENGLDELTKGNAKLNVR